LAKEGQHIKVTGTHVLDTGSQGMEIHPAFHIG
jgi:hypothetical protein